MHKNGLAETIVFSYANNIDFVFSPEGKFFLTVPDEQSTLSIYVLASISWCTKLKAAAIIIMIII